MGSLSDKFKAMGINLGVTKPAQPAPIPGQDAIENPAGGENQPGSRLYPRSEKKVISIDQVVQGSYHTTIYGDIFGVETVYPPDYSHGNSQLAHSHSIQTISQWAKASHLADALLDGFIFLDTATSGLAGGTGTFAFLVGVGRYTP